MIFSGIVLQSFRQLNFYEEGLAAYQQFVHVRYLCGFH